MTNIMSLKNSIKNLFQTTAPNVAPSTTVSSVPNDAKSKDETYVYYGTRICGMVTASLPVFSGFLLRVYNLEKQQQANDVRIQNEYKNELQKKIVETNDAISNVNAELTKINQKIADKEEQIKENDIKLIEAKNKDGEENRSAKVKLYIGLTILVIITLYLFIFYSSTFYSAFFKNFDVNIGIGDAMFDSKAIPHALSDGIGELAFILCAPVIFMGLGYGLHFFMQQSSWTKYLKTGCVLGITFIFDCILAYLIAQKIYNIEILTKLGEYPDFNMNMAVHDINVWAVIFCGFIVYIIWGIVFDMTLTAYGELRSNKKEIEKYETHKDHLKEELSEEKNKLAEKNAELAQLDNKRNSL
ncbi:MAG: tektin family protein, partial [Muribaculaceae bacterium]|nr:tektin family protein [Muribaculaceae bacterium]